MLVERSSALCQAITLMVVVGCLGPQPRQLDQQGGAGTGGAGTSTGGGSSAESTSGTTAQGTTDASSSASSAATTGGEGGGGGSPSCPPNTYGPTCIPCNCQNRSSCDDGMTGTGACTCQPGTFGADCGGACACASAPCVDGASGDGTCLFSTCAEVLAANPAAPDGDYTLYLDHDVTKAWEAYCDAMSGTPREYLRLLQPNTFEDRVPWQDPKFINYSRVRIDPITLVVKVTDQTFATRTGNLTGAAPDYATASSCKAYNGNGDVGHGKIDLQGTPFFVQDSFSHYGWCSYHSAVFSSNNQVVDLVGDGQCGAVAPLSYASYYGDGCNGEVADPTQDPDWSLQLAFLP